MSPRLPGTGSPRSEEMLRRGFVIVPKLELHSQLACLKKLVSVMIGRWRICVQQFHVAHTSTKLNVCGPWVTAWMPWMPVAEGGRSPRRYRLGGRESGTNPPGRFVAPIAPPDTARR